MLIIIHKKNDEQFLVECNHVFFFILLTIHSLIDMDNDSDHMIRMDFAVVVLDMDYEIDRYLHHS